MHKILNATKCYVASKPHTEKNIYYVDVIRENIYIAKAQWEKVASN